jgi:hypothetical protein
MRNSSPASLEVTFKDNLCVADMTGEGFQWLLLLLESGENEPELESKRSPTLGAWLNELPQTDLCNG